MDSNELYDEKFFLEQEEGSYKSAKIIIPIVLDLISVDTVVDVGCGVGTWLRVFKEHGCKVQGLDGEYVLERKNYIQRGEFVPIDLSRQRFMNKNKFDLIVSVEVAEHLPKEKADIFVEDLTNLGDIVLFSAAIPNQGGINHINEQFQSYWEEKFKKRGFVPIDCIRPLIWNNQHVEWWYRQNILLYVKEKEMSKYPFLFGLYISRKKQMIDIVHPALFNRRINALEEENINLRKNTKIKNVFYCKTIRQLLVALLLTYHKVEDVNYLFINEYLRNRAPNLSDLKIGDKKLFKEIVVYKTRYIGNPTTVDENIYLNELEEYYDKLCSNHSIILDEIDRFYLFSTLRFSIYLTRKKKKFYLFEDSSGTASKYGMVQWCEENPVGIDKRKIAEMLGLLDGSCSYIEKNYIDVKKQTKEINKGDVYNFDILELIKNTDKLGLTIAHSAFSYGDNREDSRKVVNYILLTQNVAMEGLKYSRIFFWTFLMDVFVPTDKCVMMKAHPADRNNYSEILESNFVINSNLPFELLSSLYKFEKAIVVSTTASIDKETEVIRLGNDIVKFKLLENMATIFFLKAYGIKVKTFFYQGKYKNVFDTIYNEKFKCCEDEKGKVCVGFDDYTEMEKCISSDSKLMFYSSENEMRNITDTFNYIIKANFVFGDKEKDVYVGVIGNLYNLNLAKKTIQLRYSKTIINYEVCQKI